MTSISSTPSTTSSTSVSNGLGGLISGMDIDSLVVQLTISEQQKIDQQEQSLQKLEWKQTAYRDIISAVTEFKDTYFDTLSSTNLRSTTFFNSSTATASSDAVTVTAAANATVGQMSIESISQLATSAKLSGVSTVSKALSGALTQTGTLTESEIATLLSSIEGSSMTLTIDGKTRTISFDATFSAAAGTTALSLETALQELIDNTFGKSSTGASLIDASITDNILQFSSSSSTISVGGDAAALTALGFSSGQSNRISTASTLSNLSLNTVLSGETFEFTINEVSFSFSSANTLDEIIQKINSSSDAGVTIKYSSVSDTFSMTADATGSGDNIRINQTTGNLLTALFGTDTFMETEGLNAELVIDGQTIIRSSNTFTIDGVKIELNDITAAGADPIMIDVESDSTKLYDTIKNFVEDYNTLIDKIHSMISEQYDRDYPPLTDAQKEEMTESEIEKWEAKAKAGILSNDQTLRGILSKLQQTMYSSGASGGISLFQIGITSAGYSENGKLVINEETLKTALESKSFEIQQLFTDTENGLSKNINTIMLNAVKTTGVRGTRGSLVELAGVASTTSATQNNIFDQIEDINERIDTLEERLEDARERWWSKFTAMESALSILNSQSAMIAGMFSS